MTNEATTSVDLCAEKDGGEVFGATRRTSAWSGDKIQTEEGLCKRSCPRISPWDLSVLVGVRTSLLRNCCNSLDDLSHQ